MVATGITEVVVSEAQALRNRTQIKQVQDEALAIRSAAQGSAELDELADDDHPLIVCPLCHTALADLLAVLRHDCDGKYCPSHFVSGGDGIEDMDDDFGEGWSSDSYPDSDFIPSQQSDHEAPAPCKC